MQHIRTETGETSILCRMLILIVVISRQVRPNSGWEILYKPLDSLVKLDRMLHTLF